MLFEWHPNDPPPEIESSSRAKLAVLRSYLSAYCDRLNVNPSREEFKLDMVDGFAGGGTFRDGTDTISGTPLIMLEETEAANERLNQQRTKRLRFDCKYYFVDKEREHTDCLRRVLTERGYQLDGGDIVVHTNRFQDVVGRIIDEVSRRQPRAGRAVFFLDQTGFAQVELAIIAQIFRELPAAEVILTFAADALSNHLAATPAIIKAASPLELTESKIHDLIQYRNGDGGRALIQRTLRDHIRSLTGAVFDTPFFIRPRQSRRALWFLHLSRHQTARDVMIQRHWELSNTFEHYGTGDFKMLGWDSLRDTETLPLFRFGEAEKREIERQLLNSLPRELYALAAESPVSVEVIRHMLANRTAARFSDLDQVILQLSRENEIEILTPAGKVRSRGLRRLSPSDRIRFPETLMFPEFSRLGEMQR